MREESLERVKHTSLKSYLNPISKSFFRTKFEEAIKKESSNISYRQMLDQLDTAHEQVTHTHSLCARRRTGMLFVSRASENHMFD